MRRRSIKQMPVEDIQEKYNKAITKADLALVRRIKEAAIGKDWEVTMLAEQSGIPYYTLKNKLHCQSRLSAVDVAKVARALGCTTDELLIDSHREEIDVTAPVTREDLESLKQQLDRISRALIGKQPQ